MERHSFAMEIKKGKKNDYRQILGEIWPRSDCISGSGKGT